MAPPPVYATLLDERWNHGSIRTMHRLPAARASGESGAITMLSPLWTKPELLTRRPYKGWS